MLTEEKLLDILFSLMNEEPKKEIGLRYNQGKLRYDLLHPVPIEGTVKILTKGSIKYAPRNWENGMPWSSIIASLKRHLAAFEKGIDFDEETGEKHIDHVACNVHFLQAYYKIAPQFDDRPHSYLEGKRIGLDIDDVLADWVPSFCKVARIETPTSWYFGFADHMARLQAEGFDYDKFMLELPVKTKPEDIPFEPTCYITSRNHTDVAIAREWIAKNGFPQVPVIQVESSADKVKVAKEMKLDIFVDDKFDTFVQMNKAGILCYLFDAEHNRRTDVGYKRIKSLKELI